MSQNTVKEILEYIVEDKNKYQEIIEKIRDAELYYNNRVSIEYLETTQIFKISFSCSKIVYTYYTKELDEIEDAICIVPPVQQGLLISRIKNYLEPLKIHAIDQNIIDCERLGQFKVTTLNRDSDCDRYLGIKYDKSKDNYTLYTKGETEIIQYQRDYPEFDDIIEFIDEEIHENISIYDVNFFDRLSPRYYINPNFSRHN